MNRRIVVSQALALLLMTAGMQAAGAQVGQPIPPEPVQSYSPADNIGHPIDWIHQVGTDKLQEHVLMQINEALANGCLSAAEASHLKRDLNDLNAQESWYKSFNTAIPAALKKKNTVLLEAMSQKLQPKQVLNASAGTALHADVDDLIARALAVHHISSAEAESYYMRLAQIESNLSSTVEDENETASRDHAGAMKIKLAQLKSELLQKIN